MRPRRTPEPAGPTVAGDGVLAVAWKSTQQGRTDLRYSRRGPGGRWAPVQVLAQGRDIGVWLGELADNAAGQTALTLAFTSSEPGADVIRCPAAGRCRAPERVPSARYIDNAP